MALDAAAFIRAGSGIVFMVAGLVALRMARRSAGGLAIGVACLSFGAGYVVVNLVTPFVLEAFWGQVAALAVYVVALAWLAASGPWGDQLPRRWLLGGLAAATVTAAIGVAAAELWMPAIASLYTTFQDVGADLTPIRLPVYGLVAAAPFSALIGVLGAWQAKRVADAPRRWALAAIMCGPSLYMAYLGGSFLAPFPVAGGSALLPVVVLGSALAVPAAWLTWLGPGRGTLPWCVAWAMLLAALAGQSEALLWGSYNTGLAGIVRILIALGMALGLLAGGLGARHGLSIPKVRRTTAAAGALAVLFIVAQIAQNFFSSEYGLLTGGVIAGAFLFAASPLQRAFERMGEKRPAAGRGRPSRSSATKEQEAAYRDALRLALRDRRFEAEEELMVSNLADRLGLTAMRATEIRLAVEKERGLR